MKLGLGIDTGGTYTDAVIYDFEGQRVMASGKSPTTKEDLAVGIGRVLDKLPKEWLGQVEFLSLSTTLATNACVEDKGGRAKLIFIGADRKVVADTGMGYGLPPAEELYFLDADIRMDGTVDQQPDWESFARDMREFLEGADAAAVVAYQGIRNPSLEQAARELLRERFNIPTVCGYELFWQPNYIKRGAGTLLNARLLPVIQEFLGAVRRNMAGKDLPMVIVRSDGTLMSESFSRQRPVETVLCGPAASVMGGVRLSGSPDSLIVDMGGTTTDIALVRNGQPVTADGVTVGKWSTFVQSVYIHTFGLGGDSQIRLSKEAGLSIGPRRVLPLCAAAARWETVRSDLEDLAAARRTTHHPVYEFLYLLRPLEDTLNRLKKGEFSARDEAVCRALGQGPMRMDRLAEQVSVDLYALDTGRLESEGLVMRCGMTPTDIMHVRGDFNSFDRRASQAGTAYMASCLGISTEELCARVYDQVEKTLYLHLLRTLLENQDPYYRKDWGPDLQRLLEDSWNRRGETAPLLGLHMRTPAALVGIGAPTHLFLPEVARALGGICVTPAEAPVANALGAVVGHISATAQTEILPVEDGSLPSSGQDDPEGTYILRTPEGTRQVTGYQEAVRQGTQLAQKAAEEEARRRGAKGQLAVTVRQDVQNAAIGYDADTMREVSLAMKIMVTASGTAGF